MWLQLSSKDILRWSSFLTSVLDVVDFILPVLQGRFLVLNQRELITSKGPSGGENAQVTSNLILSLNTFFEKTAKNLLSQMWSVNSEAAGGRRKVINILQFTKKLRKRERNQWSVEKREKQHREWIAMGRKLKESQKKVMNILQFTKKQEICEK